MAYIDCKWCHGKGCLQCEFEREKAIGKPPVAMFTAKYDDPEDMKALKKVFGREALEKAFGENGGGMQEIEENAIEISLHQLVRKTLTKEK